ncbi:PREDICTED: nucleolin 2-like [Polistes dominula]|uniref:Nucleolin 2-like n=1 Tax=Polistes dominula TaxID=743375 RepID=A0ABM1I3Z2_POLDO|nr:PREDICTED: nucleolin 2-like [Polistes dominula]
MGLPPTSPRLKFVHTHPGGSPVPRRPPRHPPSPSTRSRSLELLDQDEKKSILPVAKPEPVPRPRSKSLDGLLDEDDVVSHLKTEELDKGEEKRNDEVDNENPTSSNDTNQTSNLESTTDENLDISRKTQQQIEQSNSSEQAKDNTNLPLPVPRLKTKMSSSLLEISKVSKEENNERVSFAEKRNDKEDDSTMLLPKQLNRCTSADGEIESSNLRDDREVTNSQNRQQTIELCDNSVEPIQERLMTIVKDKSTLLKAKSCGAGLDSNESASSNDYKAEIKEQGSLLSLPAGAEPKRKRNFMDKCVNKVRSFIKR